ncbi:MAG: CNNM domain-containing protein [Verrucomicrobiota bacterium]
MMDGLAIWIVFAVCLGLSFLLSGMEAGVFALNRLRIRQQMRAGRKSAQALHGYLENPENFLWTILVGNTVVNFFVLGWLVVVLYQSFQGHKFWFIALFAVIVFLFYSFCDLLPKMLFRMFPNRLCMAMARPFRLVHLLLRPLVWLVESFSGALLRWTGGRVFTGHLFGNREELRFLMQESSQELTTEERAMINRVLDLPSLTVRNIAKPLEQAVTVDAQAPVSRALELCREHHFSRLPVWETRERQRRIAGFISLDVLLFQPDLNPARPLVEFVRPALYLNEDIRLEVALRRMQRSGQRLAIVLGRDRGEIGMITLEDIMKVVFGGVRW